MNNVIIRFLCFFLSFSVFLACKNEPKSQFPDPLEAGWQGEKVCEVIEENDKIRVLKCSFSPNVGHEKHSHQTHFGYTLTSSKFRITDEEGTKEVNVPTGTEFYNEGVTTHEVLNIGDSIAVFLIIEPK